MWLIYHRLRLKRDNQPMARVPKMTRWKISLARGIHCCTNFLNFFRPITVAILCTMCIYTYIHTHTHAWLRTDCISITGATNNTPICSQYIYGCDAGLTETGPIRQHVTLYSLLLNSSSTGTACHLFWLIALLERTVTANIIMLLCANYTVITCTDSNDGM